MANKWCDAPMNGHATQFIRHFHVVFDVPVLKLNLPIEFTGWLRACLTNRIMKQDKYYWAS